MNPRKIKVKNLAYLDDEKAIESDQPFKELLMGALSIIGLLMLVIIKVSLFIYFADDIDMLFNKYPIIPLVMCAPVIVWAGKRCYNRFVK